MSVLLYTGQIHITISRIYKRRTLRFQVERPLFHFSSELRRYRKMSQNGNENDNTLEYASLYVDDDVTREIHPIVSGSNNDPAVSNTSFLPKHTQFNRPDIDTSGRNSCPVMIYTENLRNVLDNVNRDSSKLRDTHRKGGTPKSRFKSDVERQIENNNHHDVIMKKWKLQAFVQMHLHKESHYYYRTIYNLLSIPLGMLTAASSITVFASDFGATRYIVGAMTISATIISGLISHFKPAEKAQQHSMLAQRYKIMSQGLESITKTPVHERENVDAFMKTVQKEFNVIVMSEVDPPRYVIEKTKEVFGPVHAILYGEDVVAALINNVKTLNMISVINEKSQKIPRKLQKNAGDLFEKMMSSYNPFPYDSADEEHLRTLIYPEALKETKTKTERKNNLEDEDEDLSHLAIDIDTC